MLLRCESLEPPMSQLGHSRPPTGSKASPNVRYAFNGDRIRASQRTDAMCHNRS